MCVKLELEVDVEGSADMMVRGGGLVGVGWMMGRSRVGKGIDNPSPPVCGNPRYPVAPLNSMKACGHSHIV